ncbi:MAG: shikimate dehydrogenase, partial [Firmicutes bacterium]|nr:shikimate dehydrogenase [Bacillota bacterium]
REGKTIPEIFESVGEAGFREMERKVLEELGQKSGQVIATGGGCVTIPENYRALHQNGRIIWIQRRLEDLETKGRPISESRPLKDIYEERKEMYEKFADFAIDGDIGEEMAFRNVMEALRR